MVEHHHLREDLFNRLLCYLLLQVPRHLHKVVIHHQDLPHRPRRCTHHHRRVGLVQLELPVVVHEVPRPFLVVGPFGLGQRLLPLVYFLSDEHGIDPVVVDYLGGVAVYFSNLVVVQLDLVDNGYDFPASLVELLQVGSFLAELAPELFMQFGRLHHGVLA